jgi:hypothetical protein
MDTETAKADTFARGIDAAVGHLVLLSGKKLYGEITGGERDYLLVTAPAPDGQVYAVRTAAVAYFEFDMTE